MTGAAESLTWDHGHNNNSLEHHNHPQKPAIMTHFGFQGYPNFNLERSRKPVVTVQSADAPVVSHFFRKDSATQRYSPPGLGMEQSKQEPPIWLQSRAPPSPPPPQQHTEPSDHLPPTLSPRYEQQREPLRPSDAPVIHDPHGQLSSADMKKKAMEAKTARENFDEDLRRKGALKDAKREEQKKIRSMQEHYNPWGRSGGGAPNRPLHYEDRGRSPMRERPESFHYDHRPDQSNDFNPRQSMDHHPRHQMENEEKIRKYQTDIARIKDQIEELKLEDNDYLRKRDTSYSDENCKMNGQLADQERNIGKIESEIKRLKEQQAYENQVNSYRAHSEPLTDRPYRQGGKNRVDYFTPRERPGDVFHSHTTYGADFDLPFMREGGRRNLGNPNREGPFTNYWPFNRAGGGAPLVNNRGQIQPQIRGTMAQINQERSDSARARYERQKRHTDLDFLRQQIQQEQLRKKQDKMRQIEGGVEFASDIRTKKVGYPNYTSDGSIGYNPLTQTISNIRPPPDFERMKDYKNDLDVQTEEKKRYKKLGDLEDRQQSLKHHATESRYYGTYGGGNKKGQETRKYNLDNIIHQPQTSRIGVENYMGRRN